MGSHNTIGKQNIIFFDGVCNLCNGAVNFVIDRDTENHYSFSSLQSDFAKRTLSEKGVDPTELKTIILLDTQNNLHFKSSAALNVLSNLKSKWRILSIFRFVPRFIRDFVYDLIARNRYNMFGRKDTCRIPTPELRKRFLDAY